MKKEIKFTGFRHDLEDYFRLSGVLEWSKLKHTPFIVIRPDQVEIVDNYNDLINNFKDDDFVIGQWKGNYRSDFFQFKVKDLKDYLKNKKST